MSEMLRRRDAAQAVVDRFLGAPLVFGKADCIRLGAMALREMGGRQG